MTYYARWNLGTLVVRGGTVSHQVVAPAGAAAWLRAPVEHTFWVAVILIVHYALVGLLLQALFPQAVTIAYVIRLVRAHNP